MNENNNELNTEPNAQAPETGIPHEMNKPAFTGYAPAGNVGQQPSSPPGYSPYSAEAPRAMYTDAGYRPSAQVPPTPNYYGYMGQSYAPSKKELRARKRAAAKAKRVAKKATRKGMSPAGIIALCLSCAILGTAGGAASGLILGSRMSGGKATEQTDTLKEQTPTVITQASGANVITNTVESVGGMLSGSQIYNIGSASTVAITTEITYTTYFGYTRSGSVSGSGFVISSDGYIVTNHHVIEDAAKGNYEIKVLFLDGSEYIATIVGYEEDNDVAVLKIEAENLVPVTIGDSSNLNVGESVFAIGNPLGTLEFTQTTGTVSALNREITSYDSTTGVYNSINMFQIDAAVNSGNSGGPVFNSRGEVIGVVTAKYSNSGVEGLGFAIPINDAIKIAKDLITDGYVRGKAALGIEAVTVRKSAASY
ncbi:MAG: S1C family serine protease [Oscillospiraceae bacterium]|nr:S1C family serine protease [Oscillospiraceae bacterium]